MGFAVPRRKADSFNPNRFVTRDFCDERFGRIMDKLNGIDEKITELANSKKESSRDWRNFAYTVVGGGIVAILTWILAHVPL